MLNHVRRGASPARPRPRHRRPAPDVGAGHEPASRPSATWSRSTSPASAPRRRWTGEPTVGGADRRGRRAGGRARARGLARRRQLAGRRHRRRARARGTVRSATALSPIGFWSPREAAFADAALKLSVTSARRWRGAMAPLLRTGAGRTALLGQMLAHPARMPGRERDGGDGVPGHLLRLRRHPRAHHGLDPQRGAGRADDDRLGRARPAAAAASGARARAGPGPRRGT